MQNMDSKVIVLGTGGTTAGTVTDPDDKLGYSAAQLGVAALVRAVPALAGFGDRGRAGGTVRQQAHEPRGLARTGAALRAPSGAC